MRAINALRTAGSRFAVQNLHEKSALRCPKFFADAIAQIPAVSAAQVKLLRDRTGASMGKCRSALLEERNDIDKAIEWLRKRGVKSMEKRNAESSEALLAMAVGSSSGAIIELRSETDFVTRSSLFQQLSVSIALTAVQQDSAIASAENSGDPVLTASLVLSDNVDQQQLQEKAGTTVGASLLELGSVLGERLVLGQCMRLSAKPSEGGVIAGYVHPRHADAIPGTGRMAALVALRTSPAVAKGESLSRLQGAAGQLARHVVAARPQFVSVEHVPGEVLQKERATLRAAHLAQMDPKKASKIDEQTMEKVMAGKINKFFQEVVLLKQEIVLPQSDGQPPSVERWLQEVAKEIGVEGVAVEDFRLACL